MLFAINTFNQVNLPNMIYHVIGLMSGSSIDGLDIAYCTFEEVSGKWNYTVNHATCIPFSHEWKLTLTNITNMTAKEVLLAHTSFGRWMGKTVKQFILDNDLEHKVHLIASHGHTVFHEPAQGMTFQMGDGASIASETQLPVITDLRNMDVARGGQGAPIVPIGEKLLWSDYSYFMNIGGICNITFVKDEKHVAFDVCPANRVLNLLANELGMAYDYCGLAASEGTINEKLLVELNELNYYKKPYPKSLANEFGMDVMMSMFNACDISVADKLRTMVEHIAIQVTNAMETPVETKRLMVTGGGAHNEFLMSRISEHLKSKNIEVEIPNSHLVNYKEALVMALIGVLRWREEANVLASVTGSERNSIGGALWMGVD